MKRLVLCTLLALVLLACGDPPYKGDAKITGHEYDDPDEYWQPGQHYPGSCSGGYGSTPRTCTPGRSTPGYWVHQPERFLLHVEWVDEDGKRHTDTRQVPKGAYDECPDGRTINLESMKCPPR